MKPIEIVLEGRKIWTCSECHHEQEVVSQCRKCGAPPQAFDERKEEIDNSKKAIFEVQKNILIQGKAVDKGVLVVLPVNFYVTKDLLERKLIKMTSKKYSSARAVRVLKRDIKNELNPLKKVNTRLPTGEVLEVT